MDQRRWLESESSRFFCHSSSRQLPQFVIYQRQQLLGGLRIALSYILQNARDLAHLDAPESSRPSITSRASFNSTRAVSRSFQTRPSTFSSFSFSRTVAASREAFAASTWCW